MPPDLDESYELQKMGRDTVSVWSRAVEGLSVHDLQQVAATMISCKYQRRTLLYREGVSCIGISIVQRGRVRSFHTTPSGKEFTNLVSGQGALLGLVSAMLDTSAVVSVESLDEVVVSQISRPDLFALTHAIPRLSSNFNRILAGMYVDTLARSRRTIDSAPMRLAKVLCSLGSLEAGDGGISSGEIRGLTQEDLSAMVGATRSWVAQMLGMFEELGLIRRRRGVIVIPDPTLLLRHINQLEMQTGG
jgi:CRP/FNR family cyclic AMP-dependent transcriptional regulator